MKRKIILLCVILVLSMLFASCSSCSSCNGKENDFPEPSDEVKVGMKYNDARKTVENKDGFFQLGGYLFYVDENGNNTVIELDENFQEVKSVKAFYTVKSNKKAFSEITEGMEVCEVVEKVGIPFRSVTSGLRTSDFKATDGSVFRINWNENMTVIEVYEVED